MALSDVAKRKLGTAMASTTDAGEITSAIDANTAAIAAGDVGVVNTAIATVGAGTLTGAGIAGGLITRSGSTAAYTDTTATAAQIVAAVPTPVVGQSFILTILNTVPFAETLAAGAGVTLTGNTIIPPNSSGRFLVKLTSLTAVSIYGIDAADLTNLPAAKTVSINVTTGTLAAGNITGAQQVFLTSTNATPGAQTVRTAAQMLADIPNGRVGLTYFLRIRNTGAGTFTLTADGGATVTLSGTMTIPVNEYRDFVVTFPTAITATITAVGSPNDPAFTLGVAAGYKVARGQLSTASAVDTVVTGLATVVSVVATLESDPTDTCSVATAQIGDQAGTPAAGSVVIKTWMPTTGGAAGNPTLVAATAFTKKVNWIAIGQ